MNIRNLRKMSLSLTLLLALLTPTGAVTHAKDNASPFLPKAAADRKDDLLRYSQFAEKYLVDCDDIGNQPRPSGERLKRCLTIAKELRDRFAEFTATLDTIIRNIKNGKKWTKEFDEQFVNEAAKRGLDAEIISEIKQTGVRAFLQNSFNQLRASKGELDSEVKELEAQLQKNPAAAQQTSVFQNASFESTPAPRVGRASKIIKLIVKVAKVIVAVCDATGLCT